MRVVPIVVASLIALLLLPAAPLPAQFARPERPTDCTEVQSSANIFIGHDCGEFASVMIVGRIVIQRPWSRVNRASRAERIRARREGRAPGANAAPTAAPAPRPTRAPAPTPTPAPRANTGGSRDDDVDCDAFDTQREAQKYFDARGWSASNDPFGLDDGGKPGVACESLP